MPHEGHDGFQSLFKSWADGFIEGQPPFTEIEGRDDAAHGKGVGIGKNVLCECRFGFDEDLLVRLVAILKTDRGDSPDQGTFFLI
jgi:hypothetical protein